MHFMDAVTWPSKTKEVSVARYTSDDLNIHWMSDWLKWIKINK